MKRLSDSYEENKIALTRALRVRENFDVIFKKLSVAGGEACFFYLDGFVKDTVMQMLMTRFLSLKKAPKDASSFLCEGLPYVEADIIEDMDMAVGMVLSGATVMLSEFFGPCCIVIDTRTYPARSTEEPEGDRVMRGSRDGFVETLIFNTALIRRRIRNPYLTMKYLSVGRDSRSDVVLCYMADRADMEYVKQLEGRIRKIDTDGLVMGHESLKECLIKTKWYNPFPKIRTTERPDAAAAQLLEGSVLVIVDNSPQVMVLPSSIFDFMQESNDFYFPPLTGTYIRIVRYLVFFLTLVITPLWYLMLTYPELVPSWLMFAMPEETGRLPVVVQLLLVEFIIDALRLASLNTPNMLNNSLSGVGGLILGDFAVEIGWLIPEVILYMAFVAIANFTQRSYELGYAIKFLRIFLLVSVAIFGFWGFAGGFTVCCVLVATNSTVNGKRSYLYPLIPFNGRALKTLLFRTGKSSGIKGEGKYSK